MRYRIFALWLMCCLPLPALAQVSFGFGVAVPGLSIGINVPVYPQLVRVPGYPVYYAPGLSANLFFYDGVYWAYQGDNWYASSWYNGPWSLVAPQYVPAYVLRVPVRYYRAPPPYFRGWQSNAPPRWGEHWGGDWERQRSGWNQWNRNAAPAPAPPPSYQRHYSGNRYPQGDQQQALRNQYYRYQPKDPQVQQHYRQQGAPPAPGPGQRGTHGQPAPGQPGWQGVPPGTPLPPPVGRPPPSGKREPGQDG